MGEYDIDKMYKIPSCRFRCYMDDKGDDRVYYCQLREYNVYYTECRGCTYGQT